MAERQLTGDPSSCSTLSPRTRFPGVAPHLASHQAGTSHSSANHSNKTMPAPSPPIKERKKMAASITATRQKKSTSHASARGSGPAKRSVRTTPSGVATG